MSGGSAWRAYNLGNSAMVKGQTFGPYEILDKLGQGGMGVVYRAHDSRLRRDVAVKIVPAAFAGDEDRLRRLEHEAQALASLNHPNIAQIYGVEQLEGAPALVMEFVEGRTLADRIADGPLPCEEAIGIACQIADALDAAHQKGIVHRDLKPGNVKLTSDGAVKVLDFGLAKLTAESEMRFDNTHSPTVLSPGTQAGVILGTVAYMAPEQARGRVVDRRADIWAFGCVLFEMLTGRALFQGETAPDIIASIIHNEPDLASLPPATPANVRALLARALQKDPKKRLRDMGDARLSLEELPESAPVVRSTDRGPSRAAVVGLLLVAAGAAFFAGLSVGRAPRPMERERWTGTWLGGPSPAEYPRISPDGQTLAFGAMVDGSTQVAVMKPESANWTVLTRDRTRGYVGTVSWSVDSARVYFERVFGRTGSVFSVPALGGDERLVLENAWGPEPLADGSVLVVRRSPRQRSQLHRFWPATGQLMPLDVRVVSEDSGDVSTVRVVGNGRQIVFVGRRLDDEAGPSGLHFMDLDSGEVRALAAGVDIPSFAQARFSLAGATDRGDLVFAAAADNVFRVLQLPLDGSAPARELMVLPTWPVLDVARDGTLYAELRERPMEVWRIDSDGRTTNVGGALSIDIDRPGVAPLSDGRLLIATNVGGLGQVLVVEAGRPAVAIVDTREETSGPITTAGPDRAAFLIGPESQQDIVIASTIDGRVLNRLKAPVAGAASLAASPSGDVLYYATGGSVYRLAVAGGGPARVGQGDSVAVDPRNGDLIVKTNDAERYTLTRMAPDGSNQRPIPFDGPFTMVARALFSTAVRQDRLLLPIGSTDSWYWSIGALDLQAGAIQKVRADRLLDVHGVTWTSDGAALAVTLALRGPLMRFRRSDTAAPR
jgi:hypothetical protein